MKKYNKKYNAKRGNFILSIEAALLTLGINALILFGFVYEPGKQPSQEDTGGHFTLLTGNGWSAQQQSTLGRFLANYDPAAVASSRFSGGYASMFRLEESAFAEAAAAEHVAEALFPTREEPRQPLSAETPPVVLQLPKNVEKIKLGALLPGRENPGKTAPNVSAAPERRFPCVQLADGTFQPVAPEMLKEALWDSGDARPVTVRWHGQRSPEGGCFKRFTIVLGSGRPALDNLAAVLTWPLTGTLAPGEVEDLTVYWKGR
ncbi:MAG: hypothetical protein PHS41_02900 [Victivallaceae bacterium]|nr:hypothetical protein [Victivallaceae bacterium]